MDLVRYSTIGFVSFSSSSSSQYLFSLKCANNRFVPQITALLYISLSESLPSISISIAS